MCLSVYVGDLGPVFSAFATLARKGDLFIFTVEELEKEKEEENESDIGTDDVIVGVEGMVTSIEDKEIQTQTQTKKGNRGKGGNWVLQKSGRFSHSQDYIERLIESFPSLSISSIDRIVPR